ncbi:DoxX family protein [Sphingobacterium sp. UBA5670]|uniref:DoxX family protein n=1 Tax=Sphingobacterium sp. UBA5670 TaxID=1947502 RepID=UPI0025DAA09E|nr:DoxX family protein [Sphingobacterium sp. UBA5670]
MTNTTYQKIYLGGRIFMAIWFAISGFFELSRNPVVWNITLKLGYPEHFIYILGVFKICASILFFLPNRFDRLKEWIFAGMFFDITFAFFFQGSGSRYTFNHGYNGSLCSAFSNILRIQ